MEIYWTSSGKTDCVGEKKGVLPVQTSNISNIQIPSKYHPNTTDHLWAEPRVPHVPPQSQELLTSEELFADVVPRTVRGTQMAMMTLFWFFVGNGRWSMFLSAEGGFISSISSTPASMAMCRGWELPMPLYRWERHRTVGLVEEAAEEFRTSIHVEIWQGNLRVAFRMVHVS